VLAAAIFPICSPSPLIRSESWWDLAVIALFFWHGAERMFFTLRDMRAGKLLLVRLMTDGVAGPLKLPTAALLLAIGF
jgi:fumarate reductase subunit D